MSAALVAVSAQLRAGATPVEAWSRTLGVVLAGPAPTVDALLATTSRPGGSRFRRRLRTRLLTGLPTRLPRRAEPGAAQRARAVVAAARLSDELGAPLAGVLERIASAVAADAEAEGERGAALSGPRSTAQVLAWLPVLGVALGALLGADPVGVVLSGGIGTASAVLGIVLVGLGRWWTATLLSRAGRA
ncbi:type II secretion protein F [Cellulomonas sp. zg-ZUI188]|uniref:Type II secretion protein F n=1 Tax=Cellulomonas fengjieae TaxID=2819978 RepID=A0ABS3SCF1_9CELL|nr:type II secretion protein F [Cellulomonas fengjieae]QVI67986.1 type II secretion protein F [Cellulomonas fengjieae]